MENRNNDYQQGPPPSYVYQQHSGDYAPYPQINQQQQGEQADQRWGTPVMGTPSNPNAHPDNQQAATGNFGGPDRNGSGSLYEQAQASQSTAGPGNPGQSPGGAYVQTSTPSDSSTAPGAPGKGGSMDKIRAQMAEYSKQAEDVMNRVWGHLSTGPSMANTAWGRVTAGTQLITKGGFEGVFKATFPADADEKLKKTYACFLSTSTGPVAGTLYISTKKIAFCSDRPLSYTPQGGETTYSYYKVIIPIDRVGSVNPSVNQSKPAEKYIQIITKDSFEFWFMGFVNYEKGVSNLQAVLGDRPAGGSNHEAYPPSQQPYPPPNQYGTQSSHIPPNQYGTPPP